MFDLHMHSNYSEDGEYSPAELVEQCVAQGIGFMSITDHNCIKANNQVLKQMKEKNIIYIAGIEIDCTYKDSNFHVLGYGMDFQSKDFELIEQNIRNQSLQASLQRLEYTQALGFHVTENDMWNISKDNYWDGIWTGEMFAEVLLAKPEYKEHPLLQPYRPNGSRSDNPYVNFYWDYYSQGKVCYVKTDYPTMEEVIDIIHCNHGIAVLAHPGINLKDKEHLLEEILGLGLDGIEAFSSYHTCQQADYFYQVAFEKRLLVTCGSDYHGKTKPEIMLGNHGCSLSNGEMYRQLKKFLGKYLEKFCNGK